MKKIAIIGGGISGLAVLHYLKQHFGHTAEITLYERESLTGGTIRSLQQGPCLFEWGPNGFLDNQPASLEFIEELGLTPQLIEADRPASRRYIQIKGYLHVLPMGPVSFIHSPLLSLPDKMALLGGLLKKNIPTETSIYNYVCQRFSRNIAENIVDPFISGIYAGDIKRLHMAAAFPKLKRSKGGRTRMRSFKGGMSAVIGALTQRYQQSIRTGSEISAILREADTNIIAAPAYAASKIVESVNPDLSRLLDKITYAPVAVVGLVFHKNAFRKMPDGFGYLIPSKEGKDVLGVLLESNVYEGRAGSDQMLVRVMLGGAHHPGIINDGQEQNIQKAIREIDSVYGLFNHPVETFVKLWPKAIPQYEMDYPQLRRSIAEQCARTPGLYLCANYLDGISFNDCILNARNLSHSLKV